MLLRVLNNRHRYASRSRVTVTMLIALILSSSIEMIQLFDDARECSASDVVCNVSGAVIGVALAWIIHDFAGEKRKDALKGVMNTGF